MNLPFELPKDKDWREDNLLQFFEIVSLWKMLDFAAASYMNIVHILNLLADYFQLCMSQPFVKMFRFCY